MASPIQYPLINGTRHSFASIELTLGSLIFVGFRAVNYKRSRGRTTVYGSSPDPLGKTRGVNEYTADCELYLAEWNAFQADIGAGYGDEAFQVLVTYTENGFDSIIDTLIGCTMDSTEASNSQGSDPTVRKFDLNPIKILFNGIEDLAQPLTGVQQ